MSAAPSRYPTHAEIGARLRSMTAAYPDLAHLESIGTSRQGREIWALTLTNVATGGHDEKPGFYLEGNNHGEEVIASAAALHVAEALLDRYGRDEEATRLLDRRALYIVPRVNPDGAELCLETPYRTVGNARHLPWDEQTEGLHIEDVNGDGRIVQMRIPDARGAWKIDPEEPRLLCRREPGEWGGQYFRLLPEGTMRSWDGVTLPVHAPRHGNLNRQFPEHWAPESGEYGAGDYPLEEPEAMAVARFVLEHPNIAGAQSYHSHGGVILRPSAHLPDAELDHRDVELFERLGAIGTRATGYPVVSVFESFTAPGAEPRHGAFTEWLYQQRGVAAFTTELWNVDRAAGIDETPAFGQPTQDRERRLLAWADAHAPNAFTEWEPFDHPQLGEIEVGGWDPFWIHRNPPLAWVADVVEPHVPFVVRHAMAAPELRLRDLVATHVGSDFYRIDAVVENVGFLPTHITERGRAVGVRSSVRIELVPDDDVEVVMGDRRQDLGHLAGRVERTAPYDAWRRPWGEPARPLAWMVRSPQGTPGLTLVASANAAGTARARLDSAPFPPPVEPRQDGEPTPMKDLA